MIYVGQGEDYIFVECATCGEILKVPKSTCREDLDKYILAEPAKCKCGEEFSEVIKAKPKAAVLPQKKCCGFCKVATGMALVACMGILAKVICRDEIKSHYMKYGHKFKAVK